MKQTQVRDIAPLSPLYQLRKLDVSCSELEEVISLKDLDSLEILDLHDTLVESISPLGNLKNLSYLDVGSCPLSPHEIETLQSKLPKALIQSSL